MGKLCPIAEALQGDIVRRHDRSRTCFKRKPTVLRVIIRSHGEPRGLRYICAMPLPIVRTPLIHGVVTPEIVMSPLTRYVPHDMSVSTLILLLSVVISPVVVPIVVTSGPFHQSDGGV